MKKVVAVLALLLVLCFASAAMVSAQYVSHQPNWRFLLKADDGLNGNSMDAVSLGVFSSSTDGYGVDGPGSDAQDYRKIIIPGAKNTRGVFPVFGGVSWQKDIKSPRWPDDPAYGPGPTNPYESYHKTWDLRVFCLPTDATDTSDVIRLNFQIVTSSMLPPAVFSGSPVKYTLRMIDNKGVVGAPANGTTWDIPVPTGGASLSVWHTITLPQIVVSTMDTDAAMFDGYRMLFYQTVPEPGSVLALASGLMGLAGYAIRRRR